MHGLALNSLSVPLPTLPTYLPTAPTYYSLSVPRRAGDAAGALMQLTGDDGRRILCNLEYNQAAPP